MRGMKLRCRLLGHRYETVSYQHSPDYKVIGWANTVLSTTNQCSRCGHTYTGMAFGRVS